MVLWFICIQGFGTISGRQNNPTHWNRRYSLIRKISESLTSMAINGIFNIPGEDAEQPDDDNVNNRESELKQMENAFEGYGALYLNDSDEENSQDGRGIFFFFSFLWFCY